MNVEIAVLLIGLCVVVLIALSAWDKPYCARCGRNISCRIAGGQPGRPLCSDCVPLGDPNPTGPPTWRSWLV